MNRRGFLGFLAGLTAFLPWNHAKITVADWDSDPPPLGTGLGVSSWNRDTGEVVAEFIQWQKNLCEKAKS